MQPSQAPTATEIQRHIQTTVTPGTHLVLHMEAKLRKMTLTNLLREIVHEWIDNHNHKQFKKEEVHNGS